MTDLRNIPCGINPRDNQTENPNPVSRTIIDASDQNSPDDPYLAYLFYSDSPEVIRRGAITLRNGTQTFPPSGYLFNPTAKNQLIPTTGPNRGKLKIRAFVYHLNRVNRPTPQSVRIITAIRNLGAPWSKVEAQIYRPPGEITESSLTELKDLVLRYLRGGAAVQEVRRTFGADPFLPWYLLDQGQVAYDKLYHYIANYIISATPGTRVDYQLVTAALAGTFRDQVPSTPMPNVRMDCEGRGAQHEAWVDETRREAHWNAKGFAAVNGPFPQP